MIAPYGLTCQRIPCPMGLIGEPTFSWKLRSEQQNQRQAAYRLYAASTCCGLSAPDIYDSGKVLSGETLDIRWTAEMPAPYTRTWWRVDVWDQDGNLSTSEPTWFERGPAAEDFIGHTVFAGEKPDIPYEKTSFATTAPALDMPAFPAPDPDAAPPEDMPMPDFSPKPRPEYYFRKEFAVGEGLACARLYLAASGACLVRLNGKPAGEWRNDPSPNACSLRSLYTPYDITAGLNAGRNAVAISCCNANITVLLMLAYQDGTRELIAADATWRWTIGPTEIIGEGSETYHAAQEKHGWDLPGYDDSDWHPVGIGPDPVIELYPNQDYVLHAVRQEHPASVEKTAWGTFRCRASRISAGAVRFRLTAPAGTVMKLHMAEKELVRGEILRGTDPLGNPEEGGSDCYTYVFSGNGIEEWCPRYCYSGIGWLELEGYPGDIAPEAITFETVLNDTPRISEMWSSEPMFLQLHNMLVDTIQNNFHGVLTTCPPYEKGPADGDTSVTLPAFLWNLDCLPIVRRLDDDFAATVRTRISYTEEDLQNDRVAPGMIRTVPEWSSMLVHNCRNLMDLCGIRQELSLYQEEFRRYFGNELAELHYSDYMVDSFFGGDWNSPDGNGAPEGGTLSGTCYEYFSLMTMAGLCDEAGWPEDAARYRSEAEKTKASINAKCLHGDEYQTARSTYHPAWGPPPWDGKGAPPLPVGYRQTSNVLPIAFGIVPEEKRDAVIRRLAAAIAENGYHLNTGFVGARYLLTTLSDIGHLETAYEIAAQRSYPSWGWWIDQGATTCWEQWGTFSRSYDHYFLAAGPEEWFRETLAGIRDVKDGFKTFRIAPQIPKKLEHFGMASETARGRVSSRWEKTADGLCLRLEIPVGCTAELVPPRGFGDTLTINGTASEFSTHRLGSGKYTVIIK